MKKKRKDKRKVAFYKKPAVIAGAIFSLLAVMLLFCGVSGIGFGALVAAPVMIASIKKEDIPGMSDETEKALNALVSNFNEAFKKHDEGLIKQDDVNNAVKESLAAFVKEHGIDSIAELKSALEKQGLELKALKEAGVGNREPAFKKNLKGLLTSDAFKSAIKNRQVQELEVKAADTIMTSNANGNHILSYEVLPGINAAPKEANATLPTLLKGSTSSRTIYWINRIGEQGGAAFIAEGALKPLKDWKYVEEQSAAKKIAVRTKVSTEMLQDFEYMQSEIRRLLNEDLFIEIDIQLLTGTGGENPTGILTVAGGYVSTGLDGMVAMPNNADAIRAGMLQLRTLNYTPDVVFMNPADVAVIDLTKSTTGNYIAIELNGVIRSVRIIETMRIDAGKFLLMDSSKWFVRMYQDYRIEFGWENDDFSKNLITVIAEARLHSYYNSIDAGSMMYDEFDVVKAAIAKV